MADLMEVQRLSAKMLRNLQNGETFLDYLDESEEILLEDLSGKNNLQYDVMD
jgi:hypothetical protein